jgi:hypothetical protein
MYDTTLATIWLFGCITVGLGLLIAGARAAGSALLGSVAGAIVGVTLVSSNFDLLPVGGVCGATAGTVLFGCVGLAWKPSASGSMLKGMAVASLLLTALAVCGILVASRQVCHHLDWRRGQLCLNVWGDWKVLAPLLVDAVFVALMLLAQVPRVSAGPEQAAVTASAR